MSNLSFYHDYLGFGRVPSRCLVSISQDEKTFLICFTDIGEGTSVTNASEDIVSSVIEERGLEPKECRFFERYQGDGPEEIDEVFYNWNDGKAANAHWRRVKDSNIISILNE